MELKMQEFWKNNGIYKKVKEHAAGRKRFYFCDGPPYATGEIHPGTAWNKTMKDAYIRFYRMLGYDVRDQAGFDTHGLPIEVKVEKKLGIKNKSEIEEKIGVKNFIKECKSFATKYIGVMSEQFRSVGVWMDFEDPYLTYKNEFIEKSWSTIKKAHDKGLLKEELYVVPYCPRCETTSANYELEYHDKTDPSIFVKFKVKGEDNKYLLIWTTTPWTLPANVAVMVHPNETYVEVEAGMERWILAKERVEYVQSKIDHDLIILSEFSGKALEGLEYEHPLKEEIPLQSNIKHRVVLSDRFVTMEDGTGLVHTAPGHGPEDYLVGKENGLDILCPVDGRGRFTEEAGKYQGYYVFDANERVIKDLENKNLLVHKEDLNHRYAHCWRCKTPLIYLATKQWFIKIDQVKDQMVNEIEKTYWRPKYAKEQFKSFVGDAPDWCISRQRYWGIPLPIWRCSHCGNVKVIGSREELGVQLEDLHRPEIDEVKLKCEQCGSEMERVKDVLDVWFDSGNAIWSSLREGEEFQPADLIMEGKDQIRGWFYSLLGSGVVRDGRSPYKSVMMHGYFTDEKGEKMSKSVGNFVPLAEILEKTSVDSFRFWSMQNVPWDDLKFNWDELNDTKRFINIVMNLTNYMNRFYEAPANPESVQLNHEDQWLLLRLNETVKEATEGMKALEIYRAPRAIKKFLLEDLSRFYMKIAKKRVNEGDNPEAVHYVLYKALFDSAKLLAPFAPHLAEYIYQEFYRKYEDLESIHMADWPKVEEYEFDPNLVKEFEYLDKLISAVGTARNEAKIKTRWPVGSITVVTKDPAVEKSVMKLAKILESLTNVKATKVVDSEDKVDYGKFVKVEPFENAVLYLDANITSELYAEGITNEVVRRIQAMRKELGLVEKDQIEVEFSANPEIAGIIQNNISEISKRTRSLSIKEVKDLEGKEWKIDGNRVVLNIKKL